MDKDALELQKLELELRKMPIELEKLQAEVDELELKLKSGRLALRMERWKVYPVYLTVLATIVGGTISYFQQRQQYLNQQAQEHKFKLSKEMIDLVQQLNSTSDSMQRNAAVELRFFGSPAASVLIENLGIDRKPAVSEAIINSLQTVIKDEKDQNVIANVLASIVNSAEDFLDRELQLSRPNVNLLLAHVKAIGVAGKEASAQRELREKMKRILLDARRKIQGNANINPDDMKVLGEAIDKQIKGLTT